MPFSGTPIPRPPLPVIPSPPAPPAPGHPESTVAPGSCLCPEVVSDPPPPVAAPPPGESAWWGWGRPVSRCDGGATCTHPGRRALRGEPCPGSPAASPLRRPGRLGPGSARGRRRPQGRLPALRPLQSAPPWAAASGSRPPPLSLCAPRAAGCLSVGGQRQPRRGALPFKTRVPEAVPRQRRYRKWMRRQLRAGGRQSSSRGRAGVAVAAGGAAQARAGRGRPRGCPWGAGGRVGDAGRPWTPLRSRCRR